MQLRFIRYPELRNEIGPGASKGRRVIHKTIRAGVCLAIQVGHSNNSYFW